MREALFDILGPQVAGMTVLDAFAGTGALGLEALSRGARWVTFVEAEREVASVLRRNVDHLGVASKSIVVEGTAERVIAAELTGAPFDLIFADPPYESASRAGLTALLGSPRILAPRGRLIVERSRRSDPIMEAARRLDLVRTAEYGDTCLDFYAAPPPAGRE